MEDLLFEKFGNEVAIHHMAFLLRMFHLLNFCDLKR